MVVIGHGYSKSTFTAMHNMHMHMHMHMKNLTINALVSGQKNEELDQVNNANYGFVLFANH